MSEINKSLQDILGKFQATEKPKATAKPTPKKSEGSSVLPKSLSSVVPKNIQPTKEQIKADRAKATGPVGVPFKAADGRNALRVKVAGQIHVVYSEEPLTQSDIRGAQEYVLETKYPDLFREYEASKSLPGNEGALRRMEIMSGTARGQDSAGEPINEVEAILTTLRDADKRLKRDIVEPLRQTADRQGAAVFPLAILNEIGKAAERLDTMPNRGWIQAIGAGLLDPLSLRRTVEQGPFESAFETAISPGAIFSPEATPLERLGGLITAAGVGAGGTVGGNVMRAFVPESGFRRQIGEQAGRNLIASITERPVIKSLVADIENAKVGTVGGAVDDLPTVKLSNNIDMNDLVDIISPISPGSKYVSVIQRTQNGRPSVVFIDVDGVARARLDADEIAKKLGDNFKPGAGPFGGKAFNILPTTVDDLIDRIGESMQNARVDRATDLIEGMKSTAERAQLPWYNRYPAALAGLGSDLALTNPASRLQDALANAARIGDVYSPVQAAVRGNTLSNFGLSGRRNTMSDVFNIASDIPERSFIAKSLAPSRFGGVGPGGLMVNIADAPARAFWTNRIGGQFIEDATQARKIIQKDIADLEQRLVNETDPGLIDSIGKQIIEKQRQLNATDVLSGNLAKRQSINDEILALRNMLNSATDPDIINEAMDDIRRLQSQLAELQSTSNLPNQFGALIPGAREAIDRAMFSGDSFLTPAIQSGRSIINRIPVAGQPLSNLLFRYANTLANVSVDRVNRLPIIGQAKAYVDLGMRNRARGGGSLFDVARNPLSEKNQLLPQDLRQFAEQLGQSRAGSLNFMLGSAIGNANDNRGLEIGDTNLLPNIEMFGTKLRPNVGYLGQLGGGLNPLGMGMLFSMANNPNLTPEEQRDIRFRTITTAFDQPIFNTLGNVPRAVASSGQGVEGALQVGQTLARSAITPGIVRPFTNWERAAVVGKEVQPINRVLAALQMADVVRPDRRANEQLGRGFAFDITTQFPQGMRQSWFGQQPTMLQQPMRADQPREVNAARLQAILDNLRGRF